MPDPFVSVVTPVYNTGEFVEQAIRSVLEQTYRNFEYIICNNYSTDESGEIATRYEALDPRIRVVRPPRSCSRSRISTLRSSKSRRRAVTPK
jgi:glycosyltransferase involved in cell wall biosynthesis